MKKKSLGFAIILLVGTLFVVPSVTYSLYRGKDRPRQAEPEFSPTRLIVKLKAEVDKKVTLGKVQGKVITGLAQLDSLNLKFKVEKQEKLFKEFKETALKLDKFSSVYILEVQKGTSLQQMKKEYERKPEVEYAELDYRFELFGEPDDPLFPHQWYLNNTGQGYLGVNRVPGDSNDTQVIKYGTEDADIDALEAFERDDETTTPLVGIIDTGVDLDHEDLADNIWTNPGEIPNNGIDDDHNGFVDDFYGWDFSGDSAAMQPVGDNDPTDYFGHGTHCAGIVASVRENAIGVSGMNTPCKILAIKFFPNAFLSLGAKSIVYAADMGCDVINMSFGSPFPSDLHEDALDYAVSRGVLPIAASGNSGQEDYFYPASLPQVFAVGASNSDDSVTNFSTYGEHIEVVAPGEDILSLRADSTDMYAEGGASGIEPWVHIVDGIYYLADGTSMASPCVAGVAAHILATCPGISKDSVKEMIRRSADDLPPPEPDSLSGYGRANLNSALQLLSGRLAKIDYPYENAIVSGDVAIIGTASGDSFQNYVLEYGEGSSPGEWIHITSCDLPVTNDTLGIWNSFGLTGLYTLRLTVGDQNQAVVRVIANNGICVKITSPSDGDTLLTGYIRLYGYTVVPDFSHYTLEYGCGESPPSWIPIVTSTKMVAGNILGDCVVSYSEETVYALRLIVATNAGQGYGDTVVVVTKSIVSAGWEQELSGHGSLSPAVGDIDGDGYDEIVVGIGGAAGFGFTGGIEIFTHEGEREVGWPKDTDENMMSSPALGDLDGDGVDDIAICSEQEGVHAYLSSSDEWIGNAWTTGGNDLSLATPIMADLEDNGDLEVLAVNDGGIVFAWHNDGQPVIPGPYGFFATTVWSSSIGFPCLAVADLDRDAQNEVIAGVASVHGGGVYIWDIDANPLLDPEDYSDQFEHLFGIAIANIDETDDLEIIALGADTDYVALSAFKKNGTQPNNYPIVLEDLVAGWWFGNHPAIGDLEGDGILEIVVTVWAPGEARIYAWHQDGTPLGSVGSGGLLVTMEWSDGERKREALSRLGDSIGEILTKLENMSKEELASFTSTFDEDPVFASVAETFGSPVLADVNGDSHADIIVRAGYLMGAGYERVFAWDYEGNMIPGFPLYASDSAGLANFRPYTPVIADMDKNGELEMTLATDSPDFQLISWEFDTNYDSARMPWPKYMHDKWNSARYGFSPEEGETPNIPPPNFHVESYTDNSATLAWNPRAPWLSVGYNTYRSTVSGEPGEKINDDLIPQAATQYQDLELTLGQIYYYTITNVDTDYQESDPSYEVAVGVGRPTAPTGLMAQVVGSIVPLHWNQNPIEENVTEYRIYRKDPDQADYQLFDSITITPNYVDDSGKSMGIYCYRVTAVNFLGLEGFPSESVWVDLSLLFDRTDYDVGDYPHSVFCADLDNDNDLDLAVADYSDNVSILTNDGNGVFSDRVVYDVGRGPYSIFCADLDNDNDLDLAVANRAGNNVSILKNDGNGVFPDRVDYGVGRDPRSVFCADLDNDNDSDLAVANVISDNVSILTNDGNGVFSDRVDYDVVNGPRSVFCADLDNDNYLDLAVANVYVSILTNDGSGGFPDRVDYDVGDYPLSVFCADLDNDNDLDLAVANWSSNNVSILKNDGYGGFPDRVDYGVGERPRSVFCADLDNDNDLDLAVANSVSDNVSILTNDGNGVFPDRLDYDVGDDPYSVFCADLDNDNDIDLAVANMNSGTVSILRNIFVFIDYVPGDVNMDDIVDTGDVIFLIDYLFRFGLPPAIMDAADVNGSCATDIADVVYLINYLFRDGPAPVYGCTDSDGLNRTSQLREEIAINATLQNGITTISIVSPIELLGLQLELSSPTQVKPLLLTNDGLDLVHGYQNGSLRIGLLDLDGGETISAGKHRLIQMKGKCRLISALVCDKSCAAWKVSTKNTMEGNTLPLTYALHQNYPNPFNPQTVIQYALPRACEVQITIYNMLGQKVKTLVDGYQDAGYKRVEWNGRNGRGEEIASGIYFYRIKAGDFVDSKKMVILK